MTRAVVAQGIAKKQQRQLEHFADVHELARAEGRRTCVLRPRPSPERSSVRQAKLARGEIQRLRTLRPVTELMTADDSVPLLNHYHYLPGFP